MVTGGNGADIWVAGGSGDDTVNGGDGGDRLFGNAGNDTLNGGSGNDWISGGLGQDAITCGDGLDTVLVVRATPSPPTASGSFAEARKRHRVDARAPSRGARAFPPRPASYMPMAWEEDASEQDFQAGARPQGAVANLEGHVVDPDEPRHGRIRWRSPNSCHR